MDMRVYRKNRGVGSSDKGAIWDRSGTPFCIFHSLGQAGAEVVRLLVLQEICETEHASQTDPVPSNRLQKCAVRNSGMEGNVDAGYQRGIQ